MRPARGFHKDRLDSVWIVNPTLIFLMAWDNMNVHQARLNGSSIKDSRLSKETIKLQFGTLVQRTLKLLGQTVFIPLVTSKVHHVGDYFVTMENYEATALMDCTKDRTGSSRSTSAHPR